MRPFSESLNNHVRALAPRQYVIDSHEHESWDDLRAAYRRDGCVTVSSLHCETSIYGAPLVNTAFRAWHDMTHIALGVGFDWRSEHRVSLAQRAQLVALGASQWDIDLLWADTYGQSCYFERWGRFPDNQRAFVASWIFDGAEQALAKRF